MREAMAAAVEHVRPAPDPLARLLSRKRDSRRWGWTAAAVVAAIGAAFAFGGVTSTADHVDPPPPASRADWIQRLLASPPRGSLAGDQSFTTELRAEVGQGAQVLLADEVGDHRIVVVSKSAELRLLAGPRGATVAALTAASTVVGGPLENPFVHASTSGVRVGLAPAGCEIDTAALPEATTWQPAPTGSYVVRIEPQPAEWWRATCAGVVRYAAPARGVEQVKSSAEPLATALEAETADATRGARGSVDPNLLAIAYRSFTDQMGDRLLRSPRVIWGGPLDGAEAAVLAAPAVGGGWWVCLARAVDAGVSLNPFHTMSDPFAGAPVTAARDIDGAVVVVAPGNTATARITLDGRTIVDGPLPDGIGIIAVDLTSLPMEDGFRARIDALDAAGTVVASGPLDDGPPPRDVIDRWGA
ncbi:hypothetical protein Afe04nite_08440 [Asanoa ferruginea]|nr:hypothetical protein Afe04nite_08440 [Asanoa ferruginea]